MKDALVMSTAIQRTLVLMHNHEATSDEGKVRIAKSLKTFEFEENLLTHMFCGNTHGIVIPDGTSAELILEDWKEWEKDLAIFLPNDRKTDLPRSFMSLAEFSTIGAAIKLSLETYG
jgi:hypothetical protein